MANVYSIADGYSRFLQYEMNANCTCTLIKGIDNVIVDTMTAWDGPLILKSLEEHGLTTDDISWVICTHGHSDHTGNNNLFLSGRHITGYSISLHNIYFVHPFEKGEEYIINERIKVIPTPGHTLSDVTVLVHTDEKGKVAITGDLFEREEDILNPELWRDLAGSENPQLQATNRLRVAEMADWIIPGHGPMFKVTHDVKQALHTYLENKI